MAFKGIGHCASVNNLAVRRQGWIGIETPRSALAEPGAGSGCSLAMGLEVGHVQSQLLVSDGFVGQPGSSV
jgi:hypothetical protein